VHPEIRTLDPLELWGRPAAGALASSLRWAVVAACAISIAIAAIVARALWRSEVVIGADEFWFCNGHAIALAVVLAACFVPPSRSSRFLRLVVLLPIAQLIVMLVAWGCFTYVAPALVVLESTTPMLDALPISAIVVVFGLASFGVARLVARRRRGETVHALVMMTLVHLLVLGLWLPIATRLCVGSSGATVSVIGDNVWTRDGLLVWMGRDLQCTPALIAFVLAPAFVMAAGFTALAIRCPEALRRRNGRVIGTVICVVVVGARMRFDSPDAALIVYDNFTHVLFALALLAIGALGALGVTTWVRRRPHASDRTCSGVVIDEDEPTGVVGCVEITSWLRGPRSLLRPFVLATPAGDLLVARGARLVTHLPLVTSVLHGGEAAVVLRSGDRVIVGGFIEHTDGDHPFRATSLLAPGAGGLVVTPATEETGGLTSAALAMWRPCLAYLAILTAVALPALAAVLTPQGP
jgi:hypothetical protein